MSALRLGRLPDGTRHVVVLEPAVGRITHARYGLKGAAVNPVIAGAVLIDLNPEYLRQQMERNRDIPLGLGA